MFRGFANIANPNESRSPPRPKKRPPPPIKLSTKKIPKPFLKSKQTQCDICKKIVNKENLKKHKLRKHQDKAKECPICYKKYFKDNHLELCLKKVKKNVYKKQYVCMMCQKRNNRYVTGRDFNMLRHVVARHIIPVGKEIKCLDPSCPKSKNNNMTINDFIYHIKTKHPDILKQIKSKYIKTT